MNTGGERDKARMSRSDPGRLARLLQRRADAYDRDCACQPRPLDYLVAVAGEGRVREVGVTVDEGFHAALTRGYLPSIQSNTGPAT